MIPSHALKLRICLDNGRCTWRHNKVLKEVLEAIQAAVTKANSRKIVSQRKVYFSREGFSLHCRKNRFPPRRDILAEAKDWSVTDDLERRFSTCVSRLLRV